MTNRKTLVIGGSPKPVRFSNKAIRKLLSFGHEVVAIGLKESAVDSVEIITGKPDFKNIHTVTMYIGIKKQVEYYEYILKLQPSRIIFNPGTENSKFSEYARENGIEVIEHCTLIMLNEGSF